MMRWICKRGGRPTVVEEDGHRRIKAVDCPYRPPERWCHHEKYGTCFHLYTEEGMSAFAWIITHQVNDKEVEI